MLYPVYYASRKLLPREQAYTISEKECLAIVWAIKKFEPYLHGTEFTIETDHSALKFLEKAKFDNARIMRWAIYLQSFKMDVRFIKGSENIGADFLSRI